MGAKGMDSGLKGFYARSRTCGKGEAGTAQFEFPGNSGCHNSAKGSQCSVKVEFWTDFV